MKKILAAAVAAAMMMSDASAVTLAWGTNTSTSPFYMTQGDATKSTSAAFTAAYQLVLVRIGDGTTALNGLFNTFTEVGVGTHSTKTTQLGQILGSTSITGGAALNGTKAVMMLKSVAGPTLGSYFFLDLKGSVGSRISQYTFSGIVNDSTAVTSYFPAAGVTAGAKYAPIPEPATGLLALAGAAMLIRRRRRG